MRYANSTRNVDRLFAMWQTIYPTSYGASQVAPGSTFTIASGSLQGADSRESTSPFHFLANSIDIVGQHLRLSTLLQMAASGRPTVYGITLSLATPIPS